MMVDKETFFKKEYLKQLASLDQDEEPIFGKMGVQQMIEHMAYSFQIANGRLHVENKQSEELTAKMYRFMMSDKPFMDNTPNSNLPKEPLPLRHTTIQDSIYALSLEIDHFFEVFEKDEKRIENPFFGNLNREEQLQLLFKHAQHHLRQFGAKTR